MHISLSPSLRAAYDEQYTSSLQEWRELGGKHKAQNVQDVCKELNFNRVLEVGAGEGSILMYLDYWNFCQELHALEISKSGLVCIKGRELKTIKSIEQFDGYTLPFRSDAFDLVVLLHVIEHVEYPRLLLREIKRISKYQVIEIPCEFSFDVDERVDHFLSYGHINIFTPGLLRFLLKSEGFEVISDKTQLMSLDVLKYLMYNSQKRKRTWWRDLRLRLSVFKRGFRYAISNKRQKECLAAAYTVLTRKKEAGLSIMMNSSG